MSVKFEGPFHIVQKISNENELIAIPVMEK